MPQIGGILKLLVRPMELDRWELFDANAAGWNNENQNRLQSVYSPLRFRLDGAPDAAENGPREPG